MRRFTKLLAVLLSLTMCLSLLPVAAFAKTIEDYNEEFKDILDDVKTPHEPEIPGPDEDNIDEAAGYKIADKVIQEAITDPAEAVEALDKVTTDDPEEAADGNLNKAAGDIREETTELSGVLEEALAKTEDLENVTSVPKKDAATVTEDTSETVTPKDQNDEPVLDEDGEEVEVKVPLTEIVLEEKVDENGEAVLDENGEKIMVPKVSITEPAEGVESVTIDELIESVGAAKDMADGAVQDAVSALQNAQKAVENNSEADLKTAQAAAADAYGKATEAAKSAAENYALAEDAVKTAKKAYEDTLAALEEAGFKAVKDPGTNLVTGVDVSKALEDAQTALTNAETALANAAKLKEAAEKKRDYAKVYAAAVDILTFDSEYLSPWNTSLEDTLTAYEGILDPMRAWNEVVYATDKEGNPLYQTDADEFKSDFVEFYSSEQNYMHALYEYLNRLYYGDLVRTDENGALALSDKYQEALQRVINTDQKYDIEDGEDEDILYKVLKMTVSEQVQNKMPLKKDELSAIENAITQYWRVSENAKVWDNAIANNEDAEFEMSDGENSAKYAYHVDENGIKHLTFYLNGEEMGAYDSQSPDWSAMWSFVSSMSSTMPSEMLGSIYEELYTKKDYYIAGEVRKGSLYELIEYKNRVENPKGLAHSDQLDMLAAYLDCLQYDLVQRSMESSYVSAKDCFQTNLQNTELVDLMLRASMLFDEDPYFFDRLNPDFDKWLEGGVYSYPGNFVYDLEKARESEEYQDLLAKAKADAIAAEEESLGRELTEEEQAEIEKQAADQFDQDVEMSLLARDELRSLGKNEHNRYFIERLQSRVEEARNAQATLDEAIDSYNTALANVDRAKSELNALMERVEASKASLTSAIRAAQQKLDSAENELKVAEDNRDAALEAQQKAEKDYVDAMRLAIAVLPVNPDTPDPENPENPENPDTPDTPDTPDDYDLGDTDDDDDDDDDAEDTDVTIEDEAVPLAAGPVTRAQFVDYLWRHEGSPEADAPTFPDVPADHEFAPAIGWAQANGLVNGYEDGTFQPDELVTVQMVRTILDRFDRAFGKSVVAPAALTTLTGEDGEAVLNCDEVLAEFFGEEIIPAGDDVETVA